MGNRPDSASKVLVIEDSPVQQKIIRKQIEALTSFQTLGAETMAQTRDILDSQEDDIFIAVVDLNLEDAPDGEAADLILEHNIPAIVLTASFNEKIRKSFLRKRVSDYFLKGSIKDMDPMVDSISRLAKNRHITAMVVDDARVDRSIIRELLKVQLFNVLEAADGQEALDLMKEHPETALVITDYNMPNVDGFELIKALREKHKKDRLAIIGVSAAGSGALTAMFLKNGANDFLTKPFEAEEFNCRVNQNMEMLEIVQQLRECLSR